MRGLKGPDGPYVTTHQRVATHQLPEPFRPASRPPPLMGRLLSRAPPAQKKAPLSKGAGRVSGLGDSDGLCLTARHIRRRPGIPPPRLRSAPPFDKGGFAGLSAAARHPFAAQSTPNSSLLTPPPPPPFPQTLQTLHALHKTGPLFAKPLPRLYRTMVETGAKPRYN